MRCRVGVVGVLAVMSGCGSAKPAAEPTPVTSSPTLNWLDDNRLELAPDVVLNVHNATVFGGDLTWSVEDDGDDRQVPDTAASAPGGARAWLAGDAMLCVALPAASECPEVIEATTTCGRLSPKPERLPPRDDKLTAALRERSTVALDHRGLEADDRGCSPWQVTIPDGEAPVLTRRDRQGDAPIRSTHAITANDSGYHWSWSVSINAHDAPPSIDEPREACPRSDRPGFTVKASYCYAPLGTWVGETDDTIELTGLVIYKSLDACRRAAGIKLAGVPGCSAR